MCGHVIFVIYSFFYVIFTVQVLLEVRRRALELQEVLGLHQDSLGLLGGNEFKDGRYAGG